MIALVDHDSTTKNTSIDATEVADASCDVIYCLLSFSSSGVRDETTMPRSCY